jgi:hypothetical protein
LILKKNNFKSTIFSKKYGDDNIVDQLEFFELKTHFSTYFHPKIANKQHKNLPETSTICKKLKSTKKIKNKKIKKIKTKLDLLF